MALTNNSRLITTITFSGRSYAELVASMNQWIHGKVINGPTTTGPTVVRPVIDTGGTNSKAFQDWVRKSISDLSQDAKTTAANEQELETSMNKLADVVDGIKVQVEALDKEIKSMSTDTDAKIATLSQSQQNALDSLSNNQKAAMQALIMEYQLDLQNLKDNLVPKINALEALHQGITPSIHKTTKPIIQRGTPLYNFDMRIDTNGSHIVRTVIPFKADYWVRYWTEDKATKHITEHIMQSGENDDLKFFNENNFLAFNPKQWPNDITILQIWPATNKPIPAIAGTR